MSQGFPSTKTELFFLLRENPLPVMLNFCPPMLPVLVLMLWTVGRAVYSKFYPEMSELLLRKVVWSAYPTVTC